MVFDHPLIQHKISILRNKATGTNEFRALIEEIAMLMGYEALRDLPLEDVEVETPIETCMTPMIAGRKLAVVPILRAGLGMVNGILGGHACLDGSLHLHILQRKVTEGLIAHQHGNFLDEGAELIGSCGFIAQNGNLVLNQRVVKYHYVIHKFCCSFIY